MHPLVGGIHHGEIHPGEYCGGNINLMWGILKAADEGVCYKIQKFRVILKCLTNVFQQEEKRSHFWGRRFICCLIIKDYFTCKSDNLAHIKQRANGQENLAQNSFINVLSAFTQKTILSSLLSSKTFFNLESGILTFGQNQIRWLLCISISVLCQSRH